MDVHANKFTAQDRALNIASKRVQSRSCPSVFSQLMDGRYTYILPSNVRGRRTNVVLLPLFSTDTGAP